MKKICVLGLGYIGLPTSCILATKGYSVLGVDLNQAVIDSIKQCTINIKEPGLEVILKAALNSGKLKVSTTPKSADVFIIAVPTPVTAEKKSNLEYIIAAAEMICPLLKRGDLVILESTSPPGTSREVLLPILEQTGLQGGEDFLLAYCPERVMPTRILEEIINNDRIIGGINQRSAIAAKEIYSSFVAGNIYLTDTTTAEMIKIVENTFRDVNIALVNELAKICEKLNINIWEVIYLANKHPRVNLHIPGPGVGGHCIPVDPWFIVEKAPEEAKLIKIARQINDSMPDYIVNTFLKLLPALSTPIKITLLGVSYKGNVSDTRESPAIKIISQLGKMGVLVSSYDPVVKDFPYPLATLKEALENSCGIILLAEHSQFKELDPKKLAPLMRYKLLFDTKNFLPIQEWEEAGFKVKVLGK